MGWFDNICAESRSNFFLSEQAYKVQFKSSKDLMSADECYSFIKKNTKPRELIQQEQLWKIPILLVCLGCIMVILIAFCFIFQCLVKRVQHARLPNQFEFDICQVEKSKIKSPVDRASQSEPPIPPDDTCCSCLKVK
ncbi:uncharacterized protein LOC128262242 [Drosophila gunungcola]|uniref:uncharacterized protein LOC128262242 n=1 Tax=Drosophila gunungcola TaxID=103775 RepID=UPI0022E36937|nr:uncharacterized protein LOC128262242 [Drosophila gunungcola]